VIGAMMTRFTTLEEDVKGLRAFSESMAIAGLEEKIALAVASIEDLQGRHENDATQLYDAVSAANARIDKLVKGFNVIVGRVSRLTRDRWPSPGEVVAQDMDKEVMEEPTEKPLPHKDTFNLIFIVNGEDVDVECMPDEPLYRPVDRALKQSNNTGRPGKDWEVRAETGALLNSIGTAAELGLSNNERLFLTLPVGAGGGESLAEQVKAMFAEGLEQLRGAQLQVIGTPPPVDYEAMWSDLRSWVEHCTNRCQCGSFTQVHTKMDALLRARGVERGQDPLGVGCPDCCADPGELCSDPGVPDEAKPGAHASRYRAAVHALKHAAQNFEGLDWVKSDQPVLDRVKAKLDAQITAEAAVAVVLPGQGSEYVYNKFCPKCGVTKGPCRSLPGEGSSLMAHAERFTTQPPGDKHAPPLTTVSKAIPEFPPPPPPGQSPERPKQSFSQVHSVSGVVRSWVREASAIARVLGGMDPGMLADDIDELCLRWVRERDIT
jgi:hypothetical protein